MQSSVDVKAAFLAYLKSKSSLVSLLAAAGSIKESQWQGEDFVYPAVRISLTFKPSINGCGPDDAEFIIENFSEQKSSKEAENMSSVETAFLHKKPFTQNGLKFPIVVVENVAKADASIYGWKSQVTVRTQVV